jgi:uncharacterized membrane protein YtjA (UPF0391 family)
LLFVPTTPFAAPGMVLASIFRGRRAEFPRRTDSRRRKIMLRLALLFLVIALLSALFGFGWIASMSFDAARLLFFVFLVLAVLFFIGDFVRGTPPRNIV